MAKAPVFLPLDRLSLAGLGGPRPATFHLVREIDQRQHALATLYGAPGMCVDFAVIATTAEQHIVTTRVPPGVTHIDLGILAWGYGLVNVTSSLDAVGTTYRVTTEFAEEHAEWLWTSGVRDDLGPESGRSIAMRSAPVWDWEALDLTFDFSGVSGQCGILSVVVMPVHVPR